MSWDDDPEDSPEPADDNTHSDDWGNDTDGEDPQPTSDDDDGWE